ncbi:MAG: 3-dehydroquinate synthase [Caldilineales bacterium]|nr:3-dehydroquinate synthase [Caldilineales bacterium]
MTPPPNIILTGFMAAGKSVVGRETAAQLGRTFVDMDERIAAATGMPVAELFARHGEAHFRALEADLARELAAQQGLVIAAGGGALVDATNRERLTRTGLAICLTASVETLLQRVGEDASRPLLAGSDRRQRLIDLLNRRAAAYAEIPYHIDTTGRTVAEVAAEVIAVAAQEAAGVLRLPVAAPAGQGYDVLIGAGLLAALPQLLARRGLNGAAAILSDEHVAPRWGEQALAALTAAGRPARLITLPAGERHKHLATIARIYDDLVAAGLDRSGVVLALGGGVVGDMAGFAAATYLRGVAFVQAPTTLLAMVDAAVGGKTGVDLPQGKNLVGAFKQPALVVIDPEALATLPAREFRHGLAEVVKHGLIADPELFGQLAGPGPDSLHSLIARALRVKIGVIERDPFEQGERAHLNLGHTFAHAFEQASGYAIPHGEAVAVGVLAAAHLAAARGECPPDLPGQVQAVLEHLHLPTRCHGLDAPAVLAAMATDKKRQGQRLRFVLPHAIGAVAVHDDVTPAQAAAALACVVGR